MIRLTPAQAKNALDNLRLVAPYFGFADSRAVLTHMVGGDTEVGARLETLVLYLAAANDDCITLNESAFPMIPHMTTKLAAAGVQGIVHTTAKATYYNITVARFIKQLSLALKVKYESARLMLSKPDRLLYVDYLQSPMWEPKRAEAVKRAGNACQKCKRRNVLLEVHHISYVRMGKERPEDLIAVCPPCHRDLDARSGFGKGRKEARRVSR